MRWKPGKTIFLLQKKLYLRNMCYKYFNFNVCPTVFSDFLMETMKRQPTLTMKTPQQEIGLLSLELAEQQTSQFITFE